MTQRSRSPRPRAEVPPIFEVTIAAVGAVGDGVASYQGRTVYVPFALAGERVRVRAVKETREGLRAEVVDVVRSAPERTAPVCRHFGRCGGCALQHMAAPAAAAWKRARVVRALEQRGLDGVEVAETVSIPGGTRRRAVFAYRTGRARAALGFHGRASHHVVDQAECPLLDPGILRLVDPLRPLLSAVAGSGRRGAVAVTMTETGPDVLIDLDDPPGLESIERLASFADSYDLARLSWRRRGRIEPLAERRRPRVTIGGVAVAPPPGAFLQPSLEGEAAIAERIEAVIGDALPAADLFCGLGTWALRLSRRGPVHAVDADADLVAGLAASRTATTEVRDLFRDPLGDAELERYRSVVFDPPRAGARAQTAALAAAGPPVVAAVSCNPATFARDARILVDVGYRLTGVAPIDQFPWSTHVELVAGFHR